MPARILVVAALIAAAAAPAIVGAAGMQSGGFKASPVRLDAAAAAGPSVGGQRFGSDL